MDRDDKLNQDLNCIEFMLLDEYDVPVVYEDGGENEYWFDPSDPDDTGVVVIDSSADLLQQLFVLLHEAGHVILRNNKESFKKRFPEQGRQTQSGRVEILREEVAAWEEAQKLIDKFAIDKSLHFSTCAWKNNYRDALILYSAWVEKGDSNVSSD